MSQKDKEGTVAKHLNASVNLINSLVMSGIQIKNTSAKKLQHELQHFCSALFCTACQLFVFLLVQVKKEMFEAKKINSGIINFLETEVSELSYWSASSTNSGKEHLTGAEGTHLKNSVESPE